MAEQTECHTATRGLPQGAAASPPPPRKLRFASVEIKPLRSGSECAPTRASPPLFAVPFEECETCPPPVG